MTDYTAQIKAKGLDTTGVTENIARDLYQRLGSHGMFIGEYTVDSRSETTDGKHQVKLSLTQVEPATDDALAEHLRELTRTLYQNRAVAEGQLAIDDSLEPTVKDHLTHGAKYRPHPFLPDDAAKATPICDVCGAIEDTPIHADQATLPDPFTTPDDE